MLLDIYYAIQKNDKETLFSILKHKIEKIQSDREMCEGLLNWFIVKDHVEAIELILQHGGDPDTQDEKQMSLLHWACYKGFHGLAEVLLKAGANVNIQDHNGNTPLHLVCDLGREKMVALLLAYGAHIHLKDNNGMMPINKARSSAIADLLAVYGESVKSSVNIQSAEKVLNGETFNSLVHVSALGRLDSAYFNQFYQAG